MFLLAPGALAAFLGKWQWERREWKRELLERREAMMQVGGWGDDTRLRNGWVCMEVVVVVVGEG